jgi:hypothetical protein
MIPECRYFLKTFSDLLLKALVACEQNYDCSSFIDLNIWFHNSLNVNNPNSI